MKRKKIYILIDNYDKLEKAPLYGLHLAKTLNRSVVFVAVEKVPYHYAATAVSGTTMPHHDLLNVEEMKAEIEPKLERLCMNNKVLWPYLSYEIAIGFPIAKVIGMTKSKQPHLLVVEGQNKPGTFNEWFGTIETQIAEGADCPVMIVPSNYTWQQPKKLLYLMDFTDTKVDNLRFLSKLSKRIKADLQVVLLSEKKTEEGQARYDEMRRIFQSLLNYKNVTFHHVIANKDAEKVRKIVTETAPDCLAIEPKSKSFLERLFNDYHTQRIVLQSEIPVIVM